MNSDELAPRWLGSYANAGCYVFRIETKRGYVMLRPMTAEQRESWVASRERVRNAWNKLVATCKENMRQRRARMH